MPRKIADMPGVAGSAKPGLGAAGSERPSSADTRVTAGVAPHSKMVEGMNTLLEMHNPDELQRLCEAVEIIGDYTKAQRIARINRIILVDTLSYRRLLREIWEGIIMEYWRSLGKRVVSYKIDLRTMVYQFWNSDRDLVRQAKGPYRTVFSAPPAETDATSRALDEGVVKDPEKLMKLREFIDEMKLLEEDLKDCERRLRFDRDFDAIMDFFAALGRLRKFEGEGRNRLITDISLTSKLLEEAELRATTAVNEMLEAKAARYIAETNENDARKVLSVKVKRLKELDKQCFEQKEEIERLTSANEKLSKELGNFKHRADRDKKKIAELGAEVTKLVNTVKAQEREIESLRTARDAAEDKAMNARGVAAVFKASLEAEMGTTATLEATVKTFSSVAMIESVTRKQLESELEVARANRGRSSSPKSSKGKRSKGKFKAVKAAVGAFKKGGKKTRGRSTSPPR